LEEFAGVVLAAVEPGGGASAQSSLLFGLVPSVKPVVAELNG
jgi:hypothetical protein